MKSRGRSDIDPGGSASERSAGSSSDACLGWRTPSSSLVVRFPGAIRAAGRRCWIIQVQRYLRAIPPEPFQSVETSFIDMLDVHDQVEEIQ